MEGREGGTEKGGRTGVGKGMVSSPQFLEAVYASGFEQISAHIHDPDFPQFPGYSITFKREEAWR